MSQETLTAVRHITDAEEPDWSVTNYILMAVGSHGVAILDYVGPFVEEALHQDLLDWLPCEKMDALAPFVVIEGFRIVTDYCARTGEYDSEFDYQNARKATQEEMTLFLANKFAFPEDKPSS